MGTNNPENECVTTHQTIEDTIDIVLIKGEQLTKIPQDLYIPPDAFRIFLEVFQGPLDLLLYLIKRNNMDILAIQIAPITKQYMTYVNLIEFSHFELAGEYLVMAATLAEIKSRMLLPVPEDLTEEEDPRAELVRRLQEYERFQSIAVEIDRLPRVARDIILFDVEPLSIEKEKIDPEVSFDELLNALSEVLYRSNLYDEHVVEPEAFSTRERMLIVLDRLNHESSFVPFISILANIEGRKGLIVTFLALMELVREFCVELIQNESYGAIHIKMRNNEHDANG